ncbi:putative transposase Ptta/En/Spm plant protein [Dioscorea alata]|uniref:Transposase Ptta/En/Spm plant protein n=1 Tax=Dioscorea alata TaxID=55571 RepID=A0ACB7VF97_DIOAL|nr:putative transposase Ptta/En/Spm plant protein [Dioscorea alata]
MPRANLKRMKVVRSEGTTNDGSVDGVRANASMGNASHSDRVTQVANVQPECSISTSSESSVDSNNNEACADHEDHNLVTGKQVRRGPTTLKGLYSLPPNEKILVSSNELGQPIGPEGQLLSGFLGMHARSGQWVGLHYENWRKVPKTLKEELLKFVEFVLKSLGKKWRDYKHDLKKRYFKREAGPQANKDNYPDGTVRWQWEELVDFWYSRKGEEAEKIGLACRKQQKYTHTSGSKSFATKKKETEFLKGGKVGRFELFKATHTKKNGSHLNVETEKILMVEAEILTQVIGKERHGRVRGLGLGPTPKTYYCSSSRRVTTCACQETRQGDGQFNQELVQRVQQLEQERAYYNAPVSFLQDQFPGKDIPLPNIGVSTSQSQNQSIGATTPEANTGGSC